MCFYFLVWHSFKSIIFWQIQWKGNLSTQSRPKPQETPKPQEQNHTIPHYTQKYLNRIDGVKWYLTNPNVRQRCHQCNIFSQFQSYLWFLQPENQLEKTRAAIEFSIQSRGWQRVPTLKTNLVVRAGEHSAKCFMWESGR